MAWSYWAAQVEGGTGFELPYPPGKLVHLLVEHSYHDLVVSTKYLEVGGCTYRDVSASSGRLGRERYVLRGVVAVQRHTLGRDGSRRGVGVA